MFKWNTFTNEAKNTEQIWRYFKPFLFSLIFYSRSVWNFRIVRVHKLTILLLDSSVIRNFNFVWFEIHARLHFYLMLFWKSFLISGKTTVGFWENETDLCFLLFFFFLIKNNKNSIIIQVSQSKLNSITENINRK